MSEIEVVTADPAPELAAATVPETVTPPAEEGVKTQADAPASETDPKDGDQPGGEKPEGERKPRGWVSTRINELTREKHDARRDADAERAERIRVQAELDLLKRGQPTPPPTTPVPAATAATFDPFDPQSVAAWQAAVLQQAQDTARQTAAAERARTEAEQSSKTFQTRLQEFQGKISETNEGAMRFLHDTSAPVTDDMAEFILNSSEGVAVADHLGNNYEIGRASCRERVSSPV